MECWQGLPPEVKARYAVIRTVKRTESKELVLLQDRESDARVLLRNYPGEPSVAYRLLLKKTLSHIPEIYAVEPRAGGYYVLEQFVDGKTLGGECLSLPDALCILKQVCEALTALHALGIVHRDVKPDNLLQTPTGQIYLLDLDAARQYKNHVEKDTCMLGTAGFAAPEQFGIVQTDHRADLFALGVTLNVLVTGSHPSQVLCRGPLRRIIVKCTRIDPKTRYQTARAVWRAAAPIYHLTRLSGIFLSRRKRYLAGLCTCAALLCAVCVFLMQNSLCDTLQVASECDTSASSFSSSVFLSAVSHITDSADLSEDSSSSDTLFSFVSKLFGSSAHEPISASSNADVGLNAGSPASKPSSNQSSSRPMSSSSGSRPSSSKPSSSSHSSSSTPSSSSHSSSSKPSSSSHSSSSTSSSSSSTGPNWAVIRPFLDGEEKLYRASESATNNMANSYLEIVNQRSLLQGQLDTLTANCSTCDANVIAQADIVSDLQGKLDAALSQDPPADEATQTWYRLELEKEQSRLQTLQSAQSEAYAARDAFLATGALDAQNAAVEQAFHEYEAQYASYLAARQRMIDAQNSVGLTQVAFPHDSEPPDPSILPR